MKTIGMLGGMSWSSTVEYYRIINEETAQRLGGLHSAPILLHSVDFDEIAAMQRRNDWAAAGVKLAAAARGLEHAGAELLLIGANTMHKVAEQVREAIGIPLVHVAEATAQSILSVGLHSVALLGTQYVMEQDFLRGKLAADGLQIMIPEDEDRVEVHRMIFEELCQGKFLPESRARMSRIMTRLADRGAEGIILGCTEISLLVTQADAEVPLFDTTRIHAISAVEAALAGRG